MNRIDTIELATEERADLLAFVEQLPSELWDAPTLCTDWRVRDVVAHTVGFDGLTPRELVARFLAGRLSVNRINALEVAEFENHSPSQLCELVRSHLRPSGLAAGFGGRIALTDNMIHQQDIRRPLGMPRDIPARRLTVALDFARTAPLIRGAWRARGLRLEADDLDWSAGSGPLVRGPGEALLMVMAGRSSGLADLSGPGVAALTARVG